MNKKIIQAQKRLEEAKDERIRKKIKYDCQTVILEGQRNTLINLENINNDVLKEFTDSDRAVEEFQKQLQITINEELQEDEKSEEDN